MNAKELITKGTILLLQKQPFYASLVLRMDISEHSSAKTACTDGKSIHYNPAFIETLNIRETAGLLAHEVLHVTLFHHTRRYKREPMRWNIACDYAINPILLEAGMSLPEGGLYNADYLGMTAEQIYALLPDCDSDTLPGFGQVTEPDLQDGKTATEAETRAAVQQALLNAKMRGNLPADLERLVEKALQAVVDWREALARFVTEMVRGDYNWTKPSVRFLHQGLYLPRLESLDTGKIILIADTSGSIDADLIEQFSGEITSIADIFNVPLQVLYVDSKFQGLQEFEVGEEVKLKPLGGGGTDFRPGFQHIDAHDLQPRAVVYLTDGECTRYPAEPDYPVLWAQFGCGYFEPPFGEVIQLSNYSPF